MRRHYIGRDLDSVIRRHVFKVCCCLIHYIVERLIRFAVQPSSLDTIIRLQSPRHLIKPKADMGVEDLRHVLRHDWVNDLELYAKNPQMIQT